MCLTFNKVQEISNKVAERNRNELSFLFFHATTTHSHYMVPFPKNIKNSSNMYAQTELLIRASKFLKQYMINIIKICGIDIYHRK